MEGLCAGQGPEGHSEENRRTECMGCRGLQDSVRQEHTGGHNVGAVSTEGSGTSSLAEGEDRRFAGGQGGFEPVGKDQVKSRDPKVPQ